MNPILQPMLKGINNLYVPCHYIFMEEDQEDSRAVTYDK